MIFPRHIKGVIFDVDDTLLDNQAAVNRGTIHEVTRLKVMRHIAKKYHLTRLAALTEEENYDAFLTAKTHSAAGAVWNTFFQKNIVSSDEIDLTHPLLIEALALINALHPEALRQYGRIVPGADSLLQLLATKFNLRQQMAVASSAPRRSINIFMDELTDFRKFFPDERVISYEDIPHHLNKPHPRPFDLAFRTLGLTDSERPNIIAFEDDPRGVISAKKAGLYVCAISTRFSLQDPIWNEVQPHKRLGGYDEIIMELKK